MMTIHRYELEIVDRQVIRAPEHATWLSVEGCRRGPEIWAMVETELPEREYTVWIVGTGNPVPSGLFAWPVKHLGHFLAIDDRFVGHVFVSTGEEGL